MIVLVGMSRVLDEAIYQPEAGQTGVTSICAKPQDALYSGMELPLKKVFYPLGYPVAIATNDMAVLEIADDTFPHTHQLHLGPQLLVNIGVIEGGSTECPHEPARREHSHLYSLVADADNQALLDLNTCTSFAWITRAAISNPLYFRYNFLEKIVYLLLGSSVVTDLHAACIAKNGRGILLCGDSGAGKSTLAYGCAREGWTYTSDDTSYLINDSATPRVIGHAHRVRFRPAARSLFPELERQEVTPRLEGKPSIEVPVSKLPVARTAHEAEVHCIVYLKRYASTAARLVRMPEGVATHRMCQELYSAGDVRARHEKILESLTLIPTYELHYSNLDDAIRQLETLT